jgi:hypothetical protein
MHAQSVTQGRLGALALGASGLLFAVFPLVRPFFPDPDPHSAASFTLASQGLAAPTWLVSHLIAILAFTLLLFGILALAARLAERQTLWGIVPSMAGIALFLPVLGTEAFAQSAIGTLYLDGNSQVAPMMNQIRYGPQRVLLFLGLLLLALGSIRLAVVIWRSGTLPKWAGVAFAIGLALFFPLFPQIVRIVDGLLIGAGSIGLANRLWQGA